jgi:predicted nucleotidyltransferase
MHLLEQVEKERMKRREELRADMRGRLREALERFAPGEQVLVFGSITRQRAFHDRSDVDIAFIDEPKAFSRYQMQARLEEHMGRPVDLVILSECRFKDKILHEGELWTS